MAWVLLLACTGDIDTDAGLLGQGLADPFPSAHLIDDAGHVDMPSELLPVAADETPWDTARLRHRTGFSPGQSLLVSLDGVDESALPGPYDLDQSDASVRLYDLTTGEQVLAFAELDASGSGALIIRPMQRLTPGHRIAALVTTAAAKRPKRFQQLLDGDPEPDLEPWQDHYDGLVRQLVGLGVNQREIALAWDFPINDVEGPLDAMVAGGDPSTAWEVLKTTNDGLPDGVHKKVVGTFEVTNWLVDDMSMEFDDAGDPIPQGTADALLYVHIPASVADAEPGTVPVVVFGHGLLQTPSMFLNDADDTSHFIELFDRMGVIVVGTNWRGLCREDLGDTVWAANDIGSFPTVTDRLTQAVYNNLSLIELVQEGGLLDDPEFLGLADSDQVSWYGVSAGAILGAVTLANTDRIEHGVLHVGGGIWSMTFPRSANFTDFEAIVETGVTSSWERQLTYSAMQLYWDPVDPIVYVDDLQDRSLLLQVAVGDDEVTNLGSETLARSAGWPMLTPSATTPEGLSGQDAPGFGPVLVQFDPEMGNPEQGNVPMDRTGAHREPRTWEATKLQTLTFLGAETQGQVVHYCGTEVCTIESSP